MRVYFLRHGESLSNAAPGVVALPEEEGDRLSALGRSQAQAAAERTAADLELSRIVCSPLRRARETAAPLAELTGLTPEIWDWIHELREPDDYAAIGSHEQAVRRWSNRMGERPDDPDHAPGGGESFADLLGRVERARERLVADDVDRTLVVGHGIFLRFMFAATVLGGGFTPAFADRLWRIGSLNCGLSTFDHVRGGGSADPADIEGWRCVTWMAAAPGMPVTGTGGDGAGA